mgnify:CR=1 FL=1
MMVRALLILSIAVVVLSLKYLPGWAAAGIALLFLLNLRFVIRYVLMRQFKQKGAVLRDALLRVHSVLPTVESPEQPQPEKRDYYQLDVTVTPAAAAIPWEPGDLVLVAPRTPSTAAPFEPQGELTAIEVWKDGAFAIDEDYVFKGEQRMRLTIGVKPEVHHIAFRYYLEVFGNITLTPSR